MESEEKKKERERKGKRLPAAATPLILSWLVSESVGEEPPPTRPLPPPNNPPGSRTHCHRPAFFFCFSSFFFAFIIKSKADWLPWRWGLPLQVSCRFSEIIRFAWELVFAFPPLRLKRKKERLKTRLTPYTNQIASCRSCLLSTAGVTSHYFLGGTIIIFPLPDLINLYLSLFQSPPLESSAVRCGSHNSRFSVKLCQATRGLPTFDLNWSWGLIDKYVNKDPQRGSKVFGFSSLLGLIYV